MALTKSQLDAIKAAEKRIKNETIKWARIYIDKKLEEHEKKTEKKLKIFDMNFL